MTSYRDLLTRLTEIAVDVRDALARAERNSDERAAAVYTEMLRLVDQIAGRIDEAADDYDACAAIDAIEFGEG